MSHFGRDGPPDITDTLFLFSTSVFEQQLMICFRCSTNTAKLSTSLFLEIEGLVSHVVLHLCGISMVMRRRRLLIGLMGGWCMVEKLQSSLRNMVQMQRESTKEGFWSISKVKSPRRRLRDDYRERDYHRRSRSRSLDRYYHDRYRERDRSYRHRSRSHSYSPDYHRVRSRDRYDRSRSPESASPPRRSRSSRKSLSPSQSVSPCTPSHSRSHTPDRRSPKGRSVSPRRSVSPGRDSSHSELEGSRSPPHHHLDEERLWCNMSPDII